jgi:hypothetical protein
MLFKNCSLHKNIDSSSGHEVMSINALFQPQDCNRLVVSVMVVKVFVFQGSQGSQVVLHVLMFLRSSDMI